MCLCACFGLDEEGEKLGKKTPTPNSCSSYREVFAPGTALGPDQQVTVFDDLISNYSSLVSLGRLARGSEATAAYFEGTNIAVYIRGTDDPDGEWWESSHGSSRPVLTKGGTLINAHYDSYVAHASLLQNPSSPFSKAPF